MLKRVRVVVEHLAPGERVLDAATAHYVQRVLRLRVGAEVCAIDPAQGTEADARLTTVGREVKLAVGATRPGTRPGLSELALVWAVGKGDKPERVLRDVVALGVGRVTFVTSERSVPRSNAARLERWRDIAVDVARQCGRADIPELSGPLSFDEALQGGNEAKRILLQPEAEARPLVELVGELPAEPGGAAYELWVGPEGGFSDEERVALEASGARGASLGPLVLRTELAATTAVGVVAMALWRRLASTPRA